MEEQQLERFFFYVWEPSASSIEPIRRPHSVAKLVLLAVSKLVPYNFCSVVTSRYTGIIYLLESLAVGRAGYIKCM
jgi:hypothetical protein